MYNKMLIFLTGHRKSGTSLLHRLFDNHPDIDVYPTDLTFFYSYFPYFTDDYSNKTYLIKRIITIVDKTINEFYITRKLIKRERVEFFNRKLKKYLNTINLKSKKKIFDAILQHWANLKGKRLKKIILVKETSQSIYFDEYLKIFGNIKMINIVRDPRDNYASIKSGQKKYYNKIGIDYLQNLASVLFRSRQDLLSCFYNRNNKRFKFITYEDLVEDPRKVMFKLCYFLNIKFYDSLLHPTIGGDIYYGNNFKKKIIGISKNNKNNWKKRITDQEKNIIEFYLSDVMKIYNYKQSEISKKLKKDFSKHCDEINSRYFYVDSLSKN